jgi:hypothetical protein
MSSVEQGVVSYGVGREKRRKSFSLLGWYGIQGLEEHY